MWTVGNIKQAHEIICSEASTGDPLPGALCLYKLQFYECTTVEEMALDEPRVKARCSNVIGY